jgi:hypothetical protein
MSSNVLMICIYVINSAYRFILFVSSVQDYLIYTVSASAT